MKLFGRETPEKEETEDDKESKELEDFVIKGEDKTGAAAAMAVMIMISAASAKLIHMLINKFFEKRTQAWRKR